MLGLAVGLSVVTAAVTSKMLVPHRGPSAVAKQLNNLTDILSSGVIRAAYVSNPPSCIIDPNTGKVSGIFAEVIETIAKNAGLKLEWTEEVGFGSMIEGLAANRYDIVPCAIWPTASRAAWNSNDRFTGNIIGSGRQTNRSSISSAKLK